MPDLAKPAALLAGLLLVLSSCMEPGGLSETTGTVAEGGPVLYNGAASAPAREEDPDRLLGLEAGAIHDILGEPALVRRDGDAEVWQFRADQCVLDLFIYGDANRVEHVDLRDRGDGRTGRLRACFAAMLKGEIPAS